jgi:hypothetical protein
MERPPLRDMNDGHDLPSPSSHAADTWRDSTSLVSNMSDLRLQDPTYCEVNNVKSQTLPASRAANGCSSHVRTGSHGTNSISTEAESQLVTVKPSDVGSEFELDSMVEVMKGPPECRYGVVRWMGHPKTDPKRLIAGLEMVGNGVGYDIVLHRVFTGGGEQCFHRRIIWSTSILHLPEQQSILRFHPSTETRRSV